MYITKTKIEYVVIKAPLDIADKKLHRQNMGSS